MLTINLSKPDSPAAGIRQRTRGQRQARGGRAAEEQAPGRRGRQRTREGKGAGSRTHQSPLSPAIDASCLGVSRRNRGAEEAISEAIIFYFFFGITRAIRGAEAGEIFFCSGRSWTGYFTKDLVKEDLIKFSRLRGCQGPGWPRP
jgi:hypothetical protein